jgi:transposase
LAEKYKLHPIQIGAWKKQLLENSSAVFERPEVVKEDPEEKLKEELFKQIGELAWKSNG